MCMFGRSAAISVRADLPGVFSSSLSYSIDCISYGLTLQQDFQGGPVIPYW